MDRQGSRHSLEPKQTKYSRSNAFHVSDFNLQALSAHFRYTENVTKEDPKRVFTTRRGANYKIKAHEIPNQMKANSFCFDKEEIYYLGKPFN